SVIGQLLFLLAFTLCFYLVGFFVSLLLMRTVRPGFFKNIYTFNHWGMHKKEGTADYSIPWKDFTKWEETWSFFYIYINNGDAHIISKKAIDEKEQEEFRDFLKDRSMQ
ncbi:MAG TPA: YcxB family protein, partial [Chitinophagaceae bacterium]|nr:YcxB family protein [Chitinophagaceae bacterium]